MKIQEAWLVRFKEVVQHEIDEAGGKAADGYRAVATKTGLGYAYIYQIFTGKPAEKPKQPGPDAMTAIERVYGKGETAPSQSAEAVQAARGEVPGMVWPFQMVAFERWERLGERGKGAVERAMLEEMERIEATQRQANGTSG